MMANLWERRSLCDFEGCVRKGKSFCGYDHIIGEKNGTCEIDGKVFDGKWRRCISLNPESSFSEWWYFGLGDHLLHPLGLCMCDCDKCRDLEEDDEEWEYLEQLKIFDKIDHINQDDLDCTKHLVLGWHSLSCEEYTPTSSLNVKK